MSEYYKTGDARTLEPYFSRHMMAMTAENLDRKDDIAMELAERDKCIALLKAVIRLSQEKQIPVPPCFTIGARQ